MDAVKEFIKTHLKKIIVGGGLLVCTFGLYGVYKIIKTKGES